LRNASAEIAGSALTAAPCGERAADLPHQSLFDFIGDIETSSLPSSLDEILLHSVVPSALADAALSSSVPYEREYRRCDPGQPLFGNGSFLEMSGAKRLAVLERSSATPLSEPVVVHQ